MQLLKSPIIWVRHFASKTMPKVSQRRKDACLANALHTLFSKRSANENHPNFLRSLGHWPWPRVILILSNGLESNSQKTPWQNLKWFSRKEFLNGVFCISLPRLFDKLGMSRSQSQWPGVTGRTGQNQCALLLEKSVSQTLHRKITS